MIRLTGKKRSASRVISRTTRVEGSKTVTVEIFEDLNGDKHEVVLDDRGFLTRTRKLDK